MEHPILVATIGSTAGQQAWSAISLDAVSSLYVDTRVSVENGVDLVVRRELRDGSGNVHHSIVDFSIACADEVSAGLRLEAARQLNPSDALIGKALLLLGTTWFTQHVEFAAAQLSAERVAADREAIEQAELDAALARQIDVYFKGSKTEPRIELRRGNSKAAIWSITFGEAWERDRFWDWLKWQRPRFHDFVEILETSDATALRSRLLREMLESEQAAKKNKLATTGRRPLRFATSAAAMAPRHVRRCPGFVNEDQLVGVEIELALEPFLTLLQDVGAILLGRMAGLFLSVIPWRAKKRHKVAMLTLTPRSANIVLNSASVGSGCCSIAARMKAAWSSILDVRRSPPCGLAAGVP